MSKYKWLWGSEAVVGAQMNRQYRPRVSVFSAGNGGDTATGVMGCSQDGSCVTG